MDLDDCIFLQKVDVWLSCLAYILHHLCLLQSSELILWKNYFIDFYRFCYIKVLIIY